jgi:hypothetical protein
MRYDFINHRTKGLTSLCQSDLGEKKKDGICSGANNLSTVKKERFQQKVIGISVLVE